MATTKIDFEEIKAFDKDGLQHTDTQDKSINVQTIYVRETNLKGIVEFKNSGSLKNVTTVEKNQLPSADDINSAKASNF